MAVTDCPDRLARRQQMGRYIGQIVLSLRVLWRELVEGGQQRGNLETVEPRVDLGDRPLLRGTVPLFNDALEFALRIPDDSPIGRGIFDLNRQESRGVLVLSAFLGQSEQRFGADQRRIPIEHDDVAFGFAQGRRRASHGMPRAALLRLVDKDQSIRQRRGEGRPGCRLDLLLLVSDNDEDPSWIETRRGSQKMRDEWPAAQPMQDLRLLTLHSGSQPGGQDQEIDWWIRQLNLTRLLRLVLLPIPITTWSPGSVRRGINE